MDDSELLELQASTVFVTADSGRILHHNSPARETAPRLYLAGCANGNVVCIRHDVPERTGQAIEHLAADEPPFRDPDSTPVHLTDYHSLLAAEAPVQHSDFGLIWTFPPSLEYDHSAKLVASDTTEGERLLAQLTEQGMPDALLRQDS